jgi:hypothetical protein
MHAVGAIHTVSYKKAIPWKACERSSPRRGDIVVEVWPAVNLATDLKFIKSRGGAETVTAAAGWLPY